jgi:acyl-CoA synthetase (AMP-forming)/AMP-acid ligase II
MREGAIAAGDYDNDELRDVFADAFTYLAGFARTVRRAGRSPAMTLPETGRIWTYAEIEDECNRPKKLGAVAAPINFRLAHGEIAYILDRARPDAFFYDREYRESAERALATASHRPQRVVVVGGDADDPRSYAAYVAPHPRTPPEVGALPGKYDETTRLFTSGTTGMPKGVPVTNLNEVLTAHDVILHLSLEPGDAILNMTPWFHRGGVHIGPAPAFYLGAQVIALRAFDADAVLDDVERYRVAYLIGAPTNLRLLLEAQTARRRDLSSLKGIVTMGAPLEREACIRYQRELCPRLFNGYGTTEAFWNTLLRPSDLPAHAGTAGRACVDDEVRVVRVYEDRRAAPDDLAAKDAEEIGEVIVRSSKCAYGYSDDPERAREVFRDGWLYIGDLATWDDEEYVTIVGRRDDMIISGGENVHPVQVEEVLSEHPLVVAYVVRRDPSLSAQQLDAFCAEHPMLARYKRPRAYRFVDALPLTATGKKRHFVMKEQARDDVARDAFDLVV